jgi:hypothetical protein
MQEFMGFMIITSPLWVMLIIWGIAVVVKRYRVKPMSAHESRFLAAAEKCFWWVEACMLLIDSKDLSIPRINWGTAYFFIGSTDYISQQYGFDDLTFIQLAQRVLLYAGYPEEQAKLILSTFNMCQTTDFGLSAITAGGEWASKWFAEKKRTAPVSLRCLFDDWEAQPQEIPIEITKFLVSEAQKSTTRNKGDN